MVVFFERKQVKIAEIILDLSYLPVILDYPITDAISHIYFASLTILNYYRYNCLTEKVKLNSQLRHKHKI